MGLKSKDNTFIYNPSAKADGKETCKEGGYTFWGKVQFQGTFNSFRTILFPRLTRDRRRTGSLTIYKGYGLCLCGPASSAGTGSTLSGYELILVQ